jgi:two-component system response regulator ChvI
MQTFAEPKIRLVLVDDDAQFRDLMAGNLEDEGFNVYALDGPNSALAFLAKGSSADAWLLDWDMPGMDGLQLLRALREKGVDQPILFLTGRATPLFEEHGLKEGAVDFVDKAKSFAILLQRVRIALAGVKSRADNAGQSDLAFEGLRVAWRDQPIDLTATEARVVRLLHERLGQDVSYRAIYDTARGEGFQAGVGADGYKTNVRAMMKRIRQKFRGIDPEFDQIEAFPGVGYRWRR